MSHYYKKIRERVGNDLIFMPSVAGIIRGANGETFELRFFSPEEMPQLALPYPKSLFLQSDCEEVYFQWNEDWLEK